MWISRSKWNELSDRVKALETGGVTTKDKEHKTHYLYGYVWTDERPLEISTSRAIMLIADHLGLVFRKYPRSEVISVEKAAKKAK